MSYNHPHLSVGYPLIDGFYPSISITEKGAIFIDGGYLFMDKILL
jgi:hypothetical protein